MNVCVCMRECMYVCACVCDVCAGTFHLIHMLMDDYLLHLLEVELERQQRRDFEKKIFLLKGGQMSYTHMHAYNILLHECMYIA